MCNPIATRVEIKNKKPKTEKREIITISLVLNIAVVSAVDVAEAVVASVDVNSGVPVGVLSVPFESS